MNSDEELYRRVLDEFGKFTREFQEYQTAREKAMNDLERRLADQMLMYWKATASGMRQLSDWFADTEDKAKAERKIVRRNQVIRDGIIIAFLIAVAAILIVKGG